MPKRLTKSEAQARRVALINSIVTAFQHELDAWPVGPAPIRTESETLDFILEEFGTVAGALDGAAGIAEQRIAAVGALWRLVNDFESRTGRCLPFSAKRVLCAVHSLTLQHSDYDPINQLLTRSDRITVPARQFGQHERQWIQAKASATATILMSIFEYRQGDAYDEVAERLDSARFVPKSGRIGPEKLREITAKTISPWVLKAESGAADFQQAYEHACLDILIAGFERGVWSQNQFLSKCSAGSLLDELESICRLGRMEPIKKGPK